MKRVAALSTAFLALGISVAAAQPAPPAPPPGLRYEQVPPPPGGRYVWEPGHWHWNGVRYVWFGGHYVMRRPGWGHYVPGRWVWRYGRWDWAPAHWAP